MRSEAGYNDDKNRGNKKHMAASLHFSSRAAAGRWETAAGTRENLKAKLHHLKLQLDTPSYLLSLPLPEIRVYLYFYVQKLLQS